MYSLQDENIHNIAVTGMFDDAQDIVKAVSNDHAFKARYKIGAVNSINWGRVAAQVVYYFKGYFAATENNDQQVAFAVPSGNFGNICAGHIARMMGLPVARLILATNENDVLDEFFRSGVYRPRRTAETHATSSPSMDISKASNFERFVFDLVGRDPAVVRELWASVDAGGAFDLTTTPYWSRIGEFGFVSGSSSHADRLATIRMCDSKYATVIDTHTADGLKVAIEASRAGRSDLWCSKPPSRRNSRRPSSKRWGERRSALPTCATSSNCRSGWRSWRPTSMRSRPSSCSSSGAEIAMSLEMWNARFAGAGERFVFGEAPSVFLTEQAALVRHGSKVLSVADGEGRNSVWLAEQGVRSMRWSLPRWRSTRRAALRLDAGVENFTVADLLDWDWPQEHYDMVVAIFIQFAAPAQRRLLFAHIKRTLKPGGLLLLHGYTPKQLEYRTGGPSARENLYTEAMLAHDFADFDLLRLAAYERHLDEGPGHSGTSALIDLVARKPQR